ncbi:MAG: UPF0175 family protein [Deferrisomatales bacterium]
MAVEVTVRVPESVFSCIGAAESEAEGVLKRELAVSFFQRGVLSFGQARQLTGLPVVEFLEVLRQREVPLHYDLAEYEEDAKVAEALR